ncbi:hypothetical protein UlMin_038193 [Ulmus minor]
MDLVLNSLEPKVSPTMNEQLDGRFVAEDVRAAIFHMAPSKSPGADGMSALFYQNYWSIVRDEVTIACLGFLNEGLDLGSINETLITLLPKVKCPTQITEFRPISLCNVLYKIISKMLATRMRSVMDSIISEEQSAFIPGRLISDNAIIGFECLHALKRRRSKKNGFLALKLDMAKAYDRVEWSFIREVMKKLGFFEGWIKKILDCLHGMRCGTNGPTISHLFFADDSLLFVEATPVACYTIKEILSQYETASGKLVNFSKSAVCFGPSIREEDIGRMVTILGVAQVKCHEHYLGLPCFSGKNKSKLFASIKDRFWWGGDISKQKMHWCTWEQLCVHKKNGGMGFRDLRFFNKAILAKQAWCIHTHPSSLVARKGDYSVRNGYWVATGRSGVASSSSSNTTTWWTRFWKLHIPPKIKIFIWKAYHDWIPTGANLANHGVPTSTICLLCNNALETTVHSLWDCKLLKVIDIINGNMKNSGLMMMLVLDGPASTSQITNNSIAKNTTPMPKLLLCLG